MCARSKMKNLLLVFSCIVFLTQAVYAVNWTSIEGNILEGEFIDYDYTGKKISILRNYDNHIFEIPEERLIHSDRIKAVLLASQDMAPYWVESFDDVKDLKKIVLVLLRNGFDRESFELFIHKLLLREEFKKIAKSRDLEVCVINEIPPELNDPELNININEWQVNTPLMLIADLRGIRDVKALECQESLFVSHETEDHHKRTGNRLMSLHDIDKKVERLLTFSIYVSLEGDDHNVGTKSKPFRTIERARDEIRELKELPAGGVNVILRGGTYPRRAGFKLTTEDSGKPDSPITYLSAPGELATLFGGSVLDRKWFNPVTDPLVIKRIIDAKARGKILECNLKTHGLIDYGELRRRGFNLPRQQPPLQLFVNGQQMTLARYPNDQQMHIGRILNIGPLRNDDKFSKQGGTFTYTDYRISMWTAANDAWINGVFGRDWSWSFNKIASIEPKGKTITLAFGEIYGLSSNDSFYAENLLEEIDLPGEYFIDRRKGMLYVLPTNDFDEAHITVSTLTDSMINAINVEHVTFRELVFDTSRASALHINGKAICIESCEIVRQGDRALWMIGTDHTIASCNIHHVGGTAIELAGGDLETLKPSGCVVENSHVHHWGSWMRVYNPAISLLGVGHVVRHSEFNHFQHMAIEVRGNDHLIEYNLFHDGPRDFVDMGVISGNLGHRPHHRGTVIRRNFFREVALAKSKQCAIYVDNGTMDWVIEGNIFYRNGISEPKHFGAIFTGGGSYLDIRYNIFVDCPSTFTQSYYFATWKKDEVLTYQKGWEDLMKKYDFERMPHGKRYPELLKLLDEDRVRPDSCVFESNLIWNPTVPLDHAGPYTTIGGSTTLVESKANYIAKENPGFPDWEAGNFALKKDADLLKNIPEFSFIYFEKIGIQRPIGPTARP